MKYAILFALSVVCAFAQAPAPAPPAAAQDPDFFENKVRPVLAENCYDCHTSAEMGGLRVDSRERMLQGGKSGPAVMPGDPDKSLLIQAVRQTGDLKMPKGGKLKPAEIQALADWVKMGAPWPETKMTGAAAAPASPSKVITPEQRAFWSFQPLKDPAIPAVKEKSWAKTNIDHFVLAKLEAKGHEAGGSGGPAGADPPRHAGPHRLAADARRSGRVRERQVAQRVREGGGPAAGVAALWRALGPPLAGCGALCRRRRAGTGSQGSRLHAVLRRVCLIATG